MTRTWIVAYWTVATLVVFRLMGHSEPRVREPVCGITRTEYRVAILGVEWSKKVRETPVLFASCEVGRTGRRADGPTGATP